MIDYLSRRYELDRLAPLFDELTLWSSRFGALLLDNIELRPDTRGLDLGCATGFPLIEIAEMHGPDSHFTGVDVWSSALQVARHKVALHGLDNVEVVEADAANLPFPDRSFNLIVSNLGVNNFERLDAVLGECSRVAKTGARIVLTTNPQGHMHEIYDIFREEVTNPGQLERLSRNESHRGNSQELQRQLSTAGFGQHRIVEDSFTMRFLSAEAMFRHHLVHWFLDGWRKIVEPAEESEFFSRIERRLNRQVAATGEIRMTVPMLYVESVRGR